MSFFMVFQDKELVHGPGWPQTHGDLPASASRVLRLKVFTATAQLEILSKNLANWEYAL